MTRTEFIQGYAKRSGLSDRWAVLGFIETAKNRISIALPCACNVVDGRHWGLVGVESIDHHFLFDAPEELKEAYVKALIDHGGV